MWRAEPGLSLRQAVALGLLQGPTELLPVSSSAHTILIPFLAGWPYAELEAHLRKSFEVALHAGTGLALAIAMRRELYRRALSLDARQAAVVALSLAPSALAGYLLQGPVERRLSGPRSAAAGLLAGAVAMALADARPAGDARRSEDAGPPDGLALGLAQAMALIPGVSRSGAVLTVARLRGFSPADAQALSWQAALPVILGASALKGSQLARAGAPPGFGRTLLAGGGAAFLSTLASARLLGRRRPGDRFLQPCSRRRPDGRILLPYSLYRCLLAAVVIARVRDLHRERRPHP